MSKAARLVHLTHLLEGRRSWLPKELAARLEVSERTVFRDLADLACHGVPIASEAGRYRLVAGAVLRPLNLTGIEHALLQVALRNPVLSRPAAVRRTLESLQAKLDAATTQVEEAPQTLHLAGLDQSGENAERALPLLEEAIRAGEEVEILYASLSGASRRWRGVRPYRAFHRSGAWYLAGHCLEHGELRLFRLDRILDQRRTGRPFAAPAGFDLDALLETSWEVFVGHEHHEVVVRFAADLAPLVENARHHPGERMTRLAGGAVDYAVTLSSLEEIARWVLGFGGGAEVLAPPALRERVIALARQVLAAHAEG